MVTEVRSADRQTIIYPHTNGELMADNTLQFALIVLIKLEERIQTANSRIETAEAKLEREPQRSRSMADRLRELGINPEQV